ncbi:YafY family transcriptional regulator [bacterium SCSIO 12741]|nr:YafY family transcriptional regulator [bacterium SCSIO 12741]
MIDTENLPRLSRLTAILTLLQSKRLVTATEIAHKFDISVRTAYRDIKALEASGVPIFVEEGKGYSLASGYSIPPILFTEDEANALITAEKIIGRNRDRSLVENYQNAITKIKATLKEGRKEKTELLSERVAFVQNYRNETNSSWLAEIQKSITDFNLIQIDYHSGSKDERTKRLIEPQALYHTNEKWILIAWCRLREQFREFRLDRMQNLQVLKETFEDRNFTFEYYYREVYLKQQATP